MRRISKGDVYNYSLNGKSYLVQVIDINAIFGHVIRVVDQINPRDISNDTTFDRFCILFPINSVRRSDGFQYIGSFPVPEKYVGDVNLRYPRVRFDDNSIAGWTLVETGVERMVKVLDDEQLNYVYAFAVNIVSLNELIAIGWNGKDYFPDLHN